jgi:hypothetical protein
MKTFKLYYHSYVELHSNSQRTSMEAVYTSCGVPPFLCLLGPAGLSLNWFGDKVSQCYEPSPLTVYPHGTIWRAWAEKSQMNGIPRRIMEP